MLGSRVRWFSGQDIEIHEVLTFLIALFMSSFLLKVYLFFLLDQKEPKNQGLHSSGYKFRRSAKISENSLRSNTEIS